MLFGVAVPGLFFFNQRLVVQRRQRLVGRAFEHDDSDDGFILGAAVPVMYDPHDPDDALIESSASDSETRLGAVVFSLAGVVLVAVGVGIISRLS
jgi:uncharacterized protein DUF3592